MAAAPTTDPAFEAQCRRIAAWSIALERATGSPPERQQEILDLAEALDAHFGWEPFETADEEPHEFAQAALASLRVADERDLDRSVEKLPVFPLAAQRALEVLLRDRWNTWDLESVASSDQALAAQLIRAANSWAHRPRYEISSISQAITFIGSDRASRVIYAAAVQPMFATPRLRDLWHHSLASAEVAQEIAELSGALDPKKAFLAGLVHDIGVLAMSTFPAVYQDLSRRLTSLGCEQVPAERALSGISHAQAGAVALKHWKFPESFCDAVAHHHTPERSAGALASILYLTEQWTDSCEDVPSAARFKQALRRVKMSEQQFESLAPSENRLMLALCG